MENPKIYEAIPKIMAEMEAIGKDRKNTQQNFMFRGIDDLYNALQKLLAKHQVFAAPIGIEFLRIKDIVSKQGTAGVHLANLYTFRFCCSDASYIDVKAIGEAVDYGDKASNKAAAIAHKYALLQTFCIPTEDDKDPDGQCHDIEPKNYSLSHKIQKIILNGSNSNNDYQKEAAIPNMTIDTKNVQNTNNMILAVMNIAYDDLDLRDKIKRLGFSWSPAHKAWTMLVSENRFNDFKQMFPIIKRGVK